MLQKFLSFLLCNIALWDDSYERWQTEAVNLIPNRYISTCFFIRDVNSVKKLLFVRMLFLAVLLETYMVVHNPWLRQLTFNYLGSSERLVLWAQFNIWQWCFGSKVKIADVTFPTSEVFHHHMVHWWAHTLSFC